MGERQCSCTAVGLYRSLLPTRKCWFSYCAAVSNLLDFYERSIFRPWLTFLKRLREFVGWLRVQLVLLKDFFWRAHPRLPLCPFLFWVCGQGRMSEQERMSGLELIELRCGWLIFFGSPWYTVLTFTFLPLLKGIEGKQVASGCIEVLIRGHRCCLVMEHLPRLCMYWTTSYTVSDYFLYDNEHLRDLKHTQITNVIF